MFLPVGCYFFEPRCSRPEDSKYELFEPADAGQKPKICANLESKTIGIWPSSSCVLSLFFGSIYQAIAILTGWKGPTAIAVAGEWFGEPRWCNHRGRGPCCNQVVSKGYEVWRQKFIKVWWSNVSWHSSYQTTTSNLFQNLATCPKKTFDLEDSADQEILAQQPDL